MKQAVFASLAGATRAEQFNYEAGRGEPRASYLLSLHEVGVDVVYLLTGRPTEAGLTDDEVELLTRYRALDVRSKVRVLDLIETVKWHRKTKPAMVFTVAENIGQQINGDVYGEVSGARRKKSSLKRK